MAKWTKEEIERLKLVYPEMGMKCAPLFGRGEKAVGVKASSLGIAKNKHTKDSIQATMPEGYKIIEYINTYTPMLVVHEDCGTTYRVTKPTAHLYTKGRPMQRCPKCWFIERQDAYTFELSEEYELVGEYKGVMNKVLHRHKECGHEWEVRPHDLQNGTGCPVCAKTGPTRANKCYLLYFPELNLYKVGISKDPMKRSKQYGYHANIVWIEEYSDYLGAKAREDEILSKVKKLNTGLLKTGNTETFVDYEAKET